MRAGTAITTRYSPGWAGALEEAEANHDDFFTGLLVLASTSTVTHTMNVRAAIMSAESPNLVLRPAMAPL